MSEVKQLTAADFLDHKSDLEEVFIEPLGGVVYLKTISTRELMTLSQKGQRKGASEIDLGMETLSLCLVDKEGNRLFSNKTIKDLMDQRPSVVLPLINKMNEMNGLSKVGDLAKK